MHVQYQVSGLDGYPMCANFGMVPHAPAYCQGWGGGARAPAWWMLQKWPGSWDCIHLCRGIGMAGTSHYPACPGGTFARVEMKYRTLHEVTTA